MHEIKKYTAPLLHNQAKCITLISHEEPELSYIDRKHILYEVSGDHKVSTINSNII